MIYIVTNIAAGNEVHRYEADAPIEWAGMEFSTHSHVELPVDLGNLNTPNRILGPISKLNYMNRFSDKELEGIYTAAKSSIAIELWLEKFKLSEFISLDDPRILQGLQALEAAGLLGPGRSTEILYGN